MNTRRESYNPLLKSYPDSERINAVSEGAECLYCRLIAQSDDAGRYYADPKVVLAKLFTHRMLGGLTVRQIANRIKELESVGLISVYQVDGKSYMQMINVVKRLRGDVEKNVFCPAPDVTTTGRRRADDVTTTGRQPNPVTDTTQPNPTQERAADAASASASFDSFWQAYPRKVAKQAAAKAFASAIKKTDAAKIIQAAEAFAKSDTGMSGEFCPHPATWLNAGRWDDDPKEWRRGDKSEPLGSLASRYLDPNSAEAEAWSPF